MARRTYKEKVSTRQVEVEENEAPAEADKDILELTDDVLAEIDDLLDDVIGESTAQAWMAGWVQKGGQ